jgi:hypothetical protein
MKEHLLKLERSLERLFGSRPATEPLEIRRAVVDALLANVQPIGRGRRALPYTKVTVHVLAASAAEKRILTDALAGRDGAEGDLRRELDRRGATLPDGFEFVVRFARVPGRQWEPGARFHVSVSALDAAAPSTEEPATPPAPSHPPKALLRIMSGQASVPTAAIDTGRLTIGRQAAVADTEGRIVRRNDVAFVGDDDASRSVSRAHGYVAWDAASQVHRVYDEASVHGTQVSRAGRLIRVPPGRDGLKLQAGDEIHVGRAVLRYELKKRP